MRWQFSDPHSPADLNHRGQVQERIDRWWEAFAHQTPRLERLFKREDQWDLPNWMASNLQAIHPQLMWEYGPAVDCDGHRLVITPESARHLRPLTETILDKAPTLPGWEFYGHRLAEPVDMVGPTVEARVGFEPEDYQVQVQIGELNRIDLCYFSPTIPSSEDQQSRHAAFVITETLLGEELLDNWIGYIDVAPLKKQGVLGSLLGKQSEAKSLIPLDRMHDTVHAAIGSLHDQLPRTPHYDWVDSAEWTGWKLEPDQQDDYCEQQDLFVGFSANPPMWTAAHQGGVFDSRRFSSVGETFCYVKLDGSEGLDEEKFADKSEIEDALNAALVPAKFGCHMGGGTGLRYSYIDLALTDLERAIDVIRKVLQAGNVPRRSWIQFFDSNWCAEWVGIYDDSPPPPMPDFDE